MFVVSLACLHISLNSGGLAGNLLYLTANWLRVSLRYFCLNLYHNLYRDLILLQGNGGLKSRFSFIYMNCLPGLLCSIYRQQMVMKLQFPPLHILFLGNELSFIVKIQNFLRTAQALDIYDRSRQHRLEYIKKTQNRSLI